MEAPAGNRWTDRRGLSFGADPLFGTWGGVQNAGLAKSCHENFAHCWHRFSCRGGSARVYPRCRYRSNRRQGIKKILLDSTKKDHETNVEMTYLGAPKYRLGITAQDFKSAEKKLKPIISEIEGAILKQKGTFKFTREDSKKTRVG